MYSMSKTNIIMHLNLMMKSILLLNGLLYMRNKSKILYKYNFCDPGH